MASLGFIRPDALGARRQAGVGGVKTTRQPFMGSVQEGAAEEQVSGLKWQTGMSTVWPGILMLGLLLDCGQHQNRRGRK